MWRGSCSTTEFLQARSTHNGAGVIRPQYYTYTVLLLAFETCMRCLHTRAHVRFFDCASAADAGGREGRGASAPSRFRCREQEVDGRRSAPAAPPESGPPPLLSVRSRRWVVRTGPGGSVECSQHGIPAALVCSLRSPSAAGERNWSP